MDPLKVPARAAKIYARISASQALHRREYEKATGAIAILEKLYPGLKPKTKPRQPL